MKKLLLILLSLCLLLTLASCGEAVSVTGATVNEDGDLIVTFSDGTTQNAGHVKGDKGDQGDKGDKGDTGESAAADFENPLGLDFYPLPDGTWAVSAGKAIYLEEITIPATYQGKAVTCIGVPEGGTDDVGPTGFYGALNLKEIVIPDSITYIGQSAFAYCSSLRSITIPSNVTSTGRGTFSYCSSLQSVTILSSVTSIGDLAFYSCNNLTNVYFAGTEAEWNAVASSAQIPNTATVTFNYTA